MKLLLLVGKILADAIADADAAALELDHPNGNAIDVEHKIRTTLAWPLEGDFLGNGEVIGFRMLPIDQGNGGGGLIGGGFHLHAVDQQRIHTPIGFIEPHLAHIGGGLQLIEGATDFGGAIAAALQAGAEDFRFDVAVASPVLPIAEVAIAERLLKQAQHAILGGALEAEAAHGCWGCPVVIEWLIERREVWR